MIFSKSPILHPINSAFTQRSCVIPCKSLGAEHELRLRLPPHNFLGRVVESMNHFALIAPDRCDRKTFTFGLESDVRVWSGVVWSEAGAEAQQRCKIRK